MSAWLMIMDTPTPITSEIFSAFLKCPLKAYLLAQGERESDTYFSTAVSRISLKYKSLAKEKLRTVEGQSALCSFKQLKIQQEGTTVICYLDCETAVYDFASFDEPGDHYNPRRSGDVIPILFSPWEKPESSDSLLVCFGALTLSQVTGILPSTGTLIYSNSYRSKTLKIDKLIPEARQIIGTIKALCHNTKPPTVVLNRHCAVCDFQSRCRRIATENDDLSLLTAMTAKERAKYSAKGIVTITQLSYGYRPRRRKRTRPDLERSQKRAKRASPAAKNDHTLRALAIKKGQTHVVGAPSLTLSGVPIFLDVEGMPDRDVYYLIGLRFNYRGVQEERSFWANSDDHEREIWESCLRTLKGVENPQVVSHAAYEIRFLKKMKERYSLEPAEVEFVDRLIGTSVNLLDCIYGKIYFPTYSNSLKAIARYVGFEWTSRWASGAATPTLRRQWELYPNEDLRRELINYNKDDCRATALVADAIAKICDDNIEFPKVDTRSLEVGFQRTFGSLDYALPEFKKINEAAYWNYQRSKVYVRTDETVRRTLRESKGRRKTVRVEKEVMVSDILEECSRCGATRMWKYPRSHIVYDLKFTRRGIKRWAVRYHYYMHRCSRCRAERTIYSPPSLYGLHLRAFVVYLLIELRLSNESAIQHLLSLFDVALASTTAHDIKSDLAERYLPTYRGIIRQIKQGPLIHADETKGVVAGGGHYVWVFANMTSVAYVYAESRDAKILNEVIDGFKGVLVSDFYPAYDSVPCVQQKCLIHLMRDINEELHKNPFDEDLKDIARRFGSLLRQIVGTIDLHGLKARHLAKHKKETTGFVDYVMSLECAAPAGVALQRRIEKNRDHLFTFLDYDGVPWNNNNAEHAVRAFTRLRNAIGTSTPKGHREYATLLSIQQTLRYRGQSFLEFLRSGRMDIGG